MYRRVFGVGVAEQIIEYRIDRARELLSSGASSVADIAREVGYADPKYFMRVFPRPIPRRFPRPPLQHRVIREGHGPNPRKSAHGRHYHVGALGTV